MMCLTAGQTSEQIGARRLYPTLPEGTRALTDDKGYDAAILIAAIVIYWI